MATTTINAACACSAFKLQIELPNSELPYERALCLCDTCRRVTGSCGISSIPLPETQVIEPSKFNATAYGTSKSYTRYFCSTCGAHILLHCLKDNSWHVPSGLADRTEGILKWVGSEWVEDTLDGGISVWLGEAPDSNGQQVQPKRWLRDAYEEVLVPEADLKTQAVSKSKSPTENLTAQCHCGGVKYQITRPDEDSKKLASGFPDFMIPFNSKISRANPNNEQWWLQANNTKYYAGLCACASCRVNSGFELQPWAFIPKCNIVQEDGKAIDFKIGTLKTYQSSEDVWREFCGVCGATVFWHCSQRPLLIDVSVGVFDPQEGARAENWLVWAKGRVGFREFSISESLIASLEAGLGVK